MPPKGYTPLTIKDGLNDKIEFVAAKLGLTKQELLERMADQYIVDIQKGKIKPVEPQIPDSVKQVLKGMGKAGELRPRKGMSREGFEPPEIHLEDLATPILTIRRGMVYITEDHYGLIS